MFPGWSLEIPAFLRHQTSTNEYLSYDALSLSYDVPCLSRLRLGGEASRSIQAVEAKSCVGMKQVRLNISHKDCPSDMICNHCFYSPSSSSSSFKGRPMNLCPSRRSLNTQRNLDPQELRLLRTPALALPETLTYICHLLRCVCVYVFFVTFQSLEKNNKND